MPGSSPTVRLALDGAWQALSLLALVASPVIAAWDVARGRGLGPIAERLGAAPRVEDAAWLLAASAGEVAAAVPLLRALAAEPGLSLALSVGTSHGLRAAARHRSLLAADPFHPPVDALPCVSRALGRLRPRALVTIETEIWPNLFRGCARRGIPVAVVNARLSDRALPRYLRARALVEDALRRVSLVAARSEDDAARWLALGAPASAVHVVGNVKFDAAAAVAAEPDLPWARAAGLTEGRWLVFGSTAEGEEPLLLDAYSRALLAAPDLRLLLAPKRPDRWDSVAALVASRDLHVTRRSGFGPMGPERPIPPGGVVLLDSVGELARGYRHARVAFVGGSLVPHGGQNLLEPAASGVPVLFGPHVANFRDAEEVLIAGGGGRRVGPEGLTEEIMKLVLDEGNRSQVASAARSAVARGEGATRRTLHLLRPWLAPRDGARP